MKTWNVRISIHALREEGDIDQQAEIDSYLISIHALREEGDYLWRGVSWITWISIHALREEGDRRSRRRLQGLTRFLSTPSARRATGYINVS